VNAAEVLLSSTAWLFRQFTWQLALSARWCQIATV